MAPDGPKVLHPDEADYQQMLCRNSRKTRKKEEGVIHMESTRMRVEDQRTLVVRQIQNSEAQQSTLQDELAKAQADLAGARQQLAEEREEAVQPRVSVGQSVH